MDKRYKRGLVGIIFGTMMAITGDIISFATLLSIYGKTAGDRNCVGAGCDITPEVLAAKIAKYLIF